MAKTDDSFNAKGPTITAFETIDEGPRVFGVKVHSNDVCGVYGESMQVPPAVGERESAVQSRTGVFGRGDDIGVDGWGDMIGVRGQSPGVDVEGQAVSGIGVLGYSLVNRAGVFTGTGGSLESQDILDTLRSPEQRDHPGQHPAQLRLVPYDDEQGTINLPENGLAGDFFVVLKPPDGNHNRQAVLWFCIQSHDQPFPGIKAKWWQLAFTGSILNGGDRAI